MSDWAKKTADKYISRNGDTPGGSSETAAERAWRLNAEKVHKVLRKKAVLETPEGSVALYCFEQIGKAIAAGEGKRKGKK